MSRTTTWFAASAAHESGGGSFAPSPAKTRTVAPPGFVATGVSSRQNIFVKGGAFLLFFGKFIQI